MAGGTRVNMQEAMMWLLLGITLGGLGVRPMSNKRADDAAERARAKARHPAGKGTRNARR